MEMHAEHIEDLAEGYALGALEPNERTLVEEHVAVCPPCKQHVNGIADTAHMLALVAPPVVPPLSCKRKLMEKVAREQFLATPSRQGRLARAVSMWATVATIAFVMTGAWAIRPLCDGVAAGLLCEPWRHYGQ
jgi:anti-sigma-K factor RskA